MHRFQPKFSTPSPAGFLPDVALPVALIVPVVALLLVTSPTLASAQETGWNFQQRGGLALAVEDFGDADLGVGYGIRLTGGYQFPQRIGLYAGWTWFRFNTDESFAGPDTEVDESGFLAGVRYEHPVRLGGPATIQLEVGTGWNEVELESGDGTLVATSEREFAWTAGAGVQFALGDGWSVGPSLRFRALSPDFTGAGAGAETNLNHLSVDVGVSQRF